MTKFAKAIIAASEQATVLEDLLERWKKHDDSAVCKLLNTTDEVEAKERIQAVVSTEAGHQVYLNDKYQVSVRDVGDFLHLSIKRLDREPIHDWRELQQIKSELVGAENEGVELYPSESRVIDTANQYHLWVAKDPAFQFPLGFNSPRTVTDESIGKSKNRPITTEK